MEQVKISLSRDLKDNVISRVEELGLSSTSEYLLD